MWAAMRLSPLPSPCPVSPPGPAPGSRLEADVDLLRDLHRLALDPGHDLLPPRLAPDLEASAHPCDHDVLVDRRVLAQPHRQTAPPPAPRHAPRAPALFAEPRREARWDACSVRPCGRAA